MRNPCGREWHYRARAFIVLASALLVANAMPVRATMVARMSLDAVTREAARVVHATVLEVRAGRDESGLPATWITLSVMRALKGPAGSTVTIKQYGVTEPLPDGTITRVAGLPRYRVGEEVVLFLYADSARGFTSPVGLAQGTYRVNRGASAARVHSDDAAAGTRDLADFLAEVQQLVTPGP